MISAAILLILKIIAVIALMVGMVIILLGIGHLYRKDDAKEAIETSKLKKDIKEKDYVISRHSVFNGFLVRNIVKKNASHK
ncbi:MAG: hypothetical protein NC328_05085 [Muribaculum sp.]|nr:hypothetical protein [Muribaculum sp.]